ncbi:MAG: hypothetical protein GX297_03125 [Treponema sp.]|nr:hypothetical protein [Treponema sp.]
MSYMLSLIPSDVTVGEHTQLIYRFESKYLPPIQKFSLDINNEIIKNANKTGFFSIYSIQFESNNSDCTLIVDFIPWKSGELSFLPFDFSSVCKSDIDSGLNINSESSPESSEGFFVIQIPPVFIRSVAEETGTSVLQPPSAPLVIPGTTYVVYLCVFGVALLFMILTVLLLRFRQIKVFIQNLLLKSKRYYNVRKFSRFLRVFLRAKGNFQNDVLSAEKISKEVRRYLEQRFNLEFESAVTSEILTIAQDFFEPCCMENLSAVQKVLARCDELRFSGEEQKKTFLNDERATLAIQLKTAILHFEKYHGTDFSDTKKDEQKDI